MHLQSSSRVYKMVQFTKCLVTDHYSGDMKKAKKEETREQKFKRYKKLSKADLIIMLVNTEFACSILMQPTRKAAKKLWDKYFKENS